MRPSSSSQITEAIRRYGVAGGMADIFVVRIGPNDLKEEAVEAAMREVVSGDIVPVNELEHVTDWASIKKVYSSSWIV